MALGAAPRGTCTWCFGAWALLVGVGVVLGTSVSVWLSPLVTTLLYGL